MAQKLTSNVNYDRFSFDLAGKHFEGKQVINGIAIGLSVTAVYGLRKYFTGGWCYITKDLTGKNVVITGGNDGIGKETARRLLELNATVIIGARDEKRNRETVEQLSKIKRGKVLAYKLDLSDKASIQIFAGNVKKQLIGQPLHYLLNNAGVMAIIEHKKTKQGLEMQIGVNHFGHFYLTYLLWDKLRLAETPRIVNVSSSAHQSFANSYDIDFSNLYYQNGGYDSFAAYSRSKKANILFTKELQRRMTHANIGGAAVTLHPGAVRTGLQKEVLGSWWRKILGAMVYPFVYFTFKTATQGAQTNLYCLLEDDRKLVKGGYYRDCHITNTLAAQVEDIEAGKRLWEQSERVFGIKFDL